MNKYLKMAICNTKITLTDTARLNFTKIYGEKSKVFKRKWQKEGHEDAGMCLYLQGMQFQTQDVLIAAADLGKLH